jgi:hypothetical protein
MALAAVEPKNLLQKVRRLILGKEKPNFLTRVSCGVGFVIWVYLVSWHFLTLIALLLYPSLKTGSDLVQANFVRVGGRYAMGEDPIKLLIGHSAVQLILYFVMLVGLILIYRKKKLGFLLYVFGGLATPFVTLLLLGYLYMSAELAIGDTLLLAASIAYFGLGALIFYRNKKEPEEV